MSPRGAIAVVVVAMLLVLAPLAMAFDHCALTGATCDGPCGTPPCAIVAPPRSVATISTESLSLDAEAHVPENTPSDLEHPPRLFAPSV